MNIAIMMLGPMLPCYVERNGRAANMTCTLSDYSSPSALQQLSRWVLCGMAGPPIVHMCGSMQRQDM